MLVGFSKLKAQPVMVCTKPAPLPVTERQTMTTKAKKKASKKASTEKQIHIPQIQWKREKVCIEGLTPLLMHKFSEKARKEIEDKQTGKATSKKAPRDPEMETEEAIHRAIDGWPSIPAASFKHAMVRAGDMCDGLAMVKLSRLIFITAPPDQLIRVYGSYVMHEGVVRLKKGGSSIPRYRPIFAEWGCEFFVDYVSNELTDEQVFHLAHIAFELGGLGDGRPSSPINRAMDFGRAKVVTKIDHLKKKYRKAQRSL